MTTTADTARRLVLLCAAVLALAGLMATTAAGTADRAG